MIFDCLIEPPAWSMNKSLKKDFISTIQLTYKQNQISRTIRHKSSYESLLNIFWIDLDFGCCLVQYIWNKEKRNATQRILTDSKNNVMKKQSQKRLENVVRIYQANKIFVSQRLLCDLPTVIFIGSTRIFQYNKTHKNAGCMNKQCSLLKWKFPFFFVLFFLLQSAPAIFWIRFSFVFVVSLSVSSNSLDL